MNREQLQKLASEWTRMAKNDIRNKVISFMREVDASERELAYVLAISDGELKQILEGNGEITLSTFAKLLIATGNALEIKPIEDTPISDYENIPTEEEFERPLPRPNVFARQKPQPTQPQFGRPSFSRPIPPMHEEDGNDFIPPMPEELRRAMEERYDRPVHRPEQPRDEYGRFAPRPSLEQVAENNYRAMQQFEQEVARRDANGRFAPKHPQMRKEEAPRREVSPFESKSTDELVKIIRERLWDSEINLNRASKEELVAFLDEKNKRMAEYKRMKALEEDPKVNEFKSKMKNTLHNNPHLREWAKKFLGELVDSE